MDAHVAGPVRNGDDFAQWMHAHASRHGFELDIAQRGALKHFSSLYDALYKREHPHRWHSPTRWLVHDPQVRGLYLWGGIGRGKTFLMDSFYEHAPLVRKRRVHFHRFMQEIHTALAGKQGTRNPLLVVARDIASNAQLLCLDEFHITDIGDAMLMRGLLEGLLAHDVVLVTTSNTVPQELYRYGLQRGQFLPAIELLEMKLDAIHVDAGTDYRLRAYANAGIYHVGESDASLQQAFLTIARHHTDGTASLNIAGRDIKVRQRGAGIVWFDFKELCDSPRGKPDYLEIAQRYHTVIVSDVPQFTVNDADSCQRFIWLVDALYDRRVKLILSATASADKLYAGSPASSPHNAGSPIEFARTASRLMEMQSNAYLREPHRH